MTWKPCFSSLGGWTWTTPPLPNGWVAMVTDASQIGTPRPTQYSVSAVLDGCGRMLPAYFDTFDEAKRAALEFAFEQQPQKERAS